MTRSGTKLEPGFGNISAVARLAWPAILSYILNNTYRINDQFWIQGLGEEAQAAIGATFFVQIFNFATIFLAVGGTLALVARATGARDPSTRASIIRHAIGFGLGLGGLIALVCLPLVGEITGALGLLPLATEHANSYLSTLFLFLPALALFPVLDSVFIGLGNTRVTMCLQLIAVALNYALNPILIYGADAAMHSDAPGAALFGSIAASLGIEGRGIAGAALATGISRIVTASSGLVLLGVLYGIRLGRPAFPQWKRIRDIAAIGAPVSISIGVYAAVYMVLQAFVISRLGQEVTAGLGLGFQIFEGVSFPSYLGVAIAGSTLVGQAVGARDPEAALRAVHSTRFLARIFGLGFAAFFFFGGPLVIDAFTHDPEVRSATLLYVQVLAFSQYWVAVETVNEKVLLGSGQTRAILWISPILNLARIPLAILLALPIGLGWGASGVWWAINITTGCKALLFWRRVQEGSWLRRAIPPRP